jgi:hypothetical protein
MTSGDRIREYDLQPLPRTARVVGHIALTYGVYSMSFIKQNQDLMVSQLRLRNIKHKVMNRDTREWFVIIEHEAHPAEVINRKTLVSKLWWLV